MNGGLSELGPTAPNRKRHATKAPQVWNTPVRVAMMPQAVTMEAFHLGGVEEKASDHEGPTSARLKHWACGIRLRGVVDENSTQTGTGNAIVATLVMV